MQRTAAAGYDSDFALWAESQALALREGRFADLDLAHLSEEIDDLSNRKRDAIRSRLTTIAVHLLKLYYQPEQASRSWLGTIVSRAARIQRLVNDSPSLRSELLEYQRNAYADARSQAAAETGLSMATFPESPTATFITSFRAAVAGEDFGGERVVEGAHSKRGS